MRGIILLPTFICWVFTLAAQTLPVDLDPLTITATLEPVKISRTGRNVIVLPGDRFHSLPVHSVDELLRYVPGVEIQQRGPAGSQSDIVLRGGTFQQVLVILDGVRLNDPNTGHFSSYIPVAPQEIERIEILKGASSAIYGTEAVGGVIHIISKSFASGRGQQRKELTVSAKAGTFGLLNASLGGTWQDKFTTVSGGMLTNNSNGQLQRGTRGFFNNHTGSVSVKHHLNSQWHFAWRSALDQRDFSAQNFYTTFLSDTADEKVTTSWNQARVGFSKGRHSITVDIGYKFVRDRFRFNPSSTANDNKSRLAQALISDHFRINANTILSSGFHFRRSSIRSNDRGNHDLNQYAAFLMVNRHWNKFSINPSIRVDNSERRGTEFIPQVNVSLRTGKFQLRGSAGKTIRDADFTERFNNYSKALVTGGSIGNPDLVAERSFSYEIGVDHFVSDELKISITGFQRRQTQLIDWVATPYSEMPRKENLSPSGTFALARNIAKINTSGLETDIHYARKDFIAALGILWLGSETDNIKSFYISSHAKFLANLNAEYHYKLFSFSATAIYKERQPQAASSINARVDKSDFLVNLRGGVSMIKRKLTAYLEVDNIFDEKASDLLGTQVPGRWFLGGITYRIK